MKTFTVFCAFCLFTVAQGCAVDKKQLWQCLEEKGDSNSDGRLTAAEVRGLVRANTAWYERLIKSPDSVARQVEDHCGLPLTYGNVLKASCFHHCGGLDGRRTIYNRICK